MQKSFNNLNAPKNEEVLTKPINFQIALRGQHENSLTHFSTRFTVYVLYYTEKFITTI